MCAIHVSLIDYGLLYGKLQCIAVFNYVVRWFIILSREFIIAIFHCSFFILSLCGFMAMWTNRCIMDYKIWAYIIYFQHILKFTLFGCLLKKYYLVYFMCIFILEQIENVCYLPSIIIRWHYDEKWQQAFYNKHNLPVSNHIIMEIRNRFVKIFLECLNLWMWGMDPVCHNLCIA